MEKFAFKLDVEDEHLDNCLFLLLLIAAKCPKSLQKPYNLKTYISYFSEIDLSESKVLKENNGLRFLYENLKKGNHFKVADNIKLELNKEFYKRVYFYKHGIRNGIISTLLFSLLLFFFVLIASYVINMIKMFSFTLLKGSLLSCFIEVVLVKLFSTFYGNYVASINLSNNLLEDKIFYKFFNKISIKENRIRTTFKHLPVSKKAICLALEEERQMLKSNKQIISDILKEKHFEEMFVRVEKTIFEKETVKIEKPVIVEKPVIIEKIVEVEKPVIVERVVEVEKQMPPILEEIDITSDEYMASNEKLQSVFKDFPTFKDYYPILCSTEIERNKKAFIVYDRESESLKWTRNQESFFELFFSICTKKAGVSEKEFKSISEAFVHKNGYKVSCHQLKVVERNTAEKAAYSKDTRILYKLLEKNIP